MQMVNLCLVKYTRPLTDNEKALLAKCIPPQRLDAIQKIKRTAQADRMRIGSALAGYMLSQYRNIPFSKQLFEENPLGKPFLVGYPDVHFNISHSEKYVICAVSDRPVGVDVEERTAYNPKIANRVFSPAVQEKIAASSDKDMVFTQCWVENEANLKRIGCGLSCKLPCDDPVSEIILFEDAVIGVSCI